LIKARERGVDFFPAPLLFKKKGKCGVGSFISDFVRFAKNHPIYKKEKLG
jgi:hypothetical protein